jgi:hypothetical protein
MMRAQSMRSSMTSPASIASWSAIPVGEVKEFWMIVPRLCLAADGAVTLMEWAGQPSGEERYGQRHDRACEQAGRDEQLRRG